MEMPPYILPYLMRLKCPNFEHMDNGTISKCDDSSDDEYICSFVKTQCPVRSTLSCVKCEDNFILNVRNSIMEQSVTLNLRMCVKKEFLDPNFFPPLTMGWL